MDRVKIGDFLDQVNRAEAQGRLMLQLARTAVFVEFDYPEGRQKGFGRFL